MLHLAGLGRLPQALHLDAPGAGIRRGGDVDLSGAGPDRGGGRELAELTPPARNPRLNGRLRQTHDLPDLPITQIVDRLQQQRLAISLGHFGRQGQQVPPDRDLLFILAGRATEFGSSVVTLNVFGAACPRAGGGGGRVDRDGPKPGANRAGIANVADLANQRDRDFLEEVV